MIICGIDPGATGAIVALKDGELLDIHDMPITPKRRGKGNETNAYLLADIIQDIGPDTVVMESVTAMPGNGATSMFSFGRSLGVIEGVIAGIGYPVQFVKPMEWKRLFNLVKKDKDASRVEAIARWPGSSHDFRLKKHNGRADAALIAAWGEQQ